MRVKRATCIALQANLPHKREINPFRNCFSTYDMLVLRRSVNVWLFLNVQLQNNALSRRWHLLVSFRQIDRKYHGHRGEITVGRLIKRGDVSIKGLSRLRKSSLFNHPFTISRLVLDIYSTRGCRAPESKLREEDGRQK